MGIDIKTYSSTMGGAPVLSGQLGTLNTILDAVLVNGFGLVSVSSVVVAGGLATVTTATPHGFLAGRVILVEGATPAGLNGEKHTITITSTTVFTFDATGIPDQTATGTITAKTPSLGWERPSAGVQAANYNYYRPLDPLSTRYGLLCADISSNYAYAGGYERLGPTGVGLSGWMAVQYYLWTKSITADATARAWTIIGDSRCFYLIVTTRTGVNTIYFFGDPISKKSGDIFGCLITGNVAGQVAQTATTAGCLSVSDRVTGGGSYSRPLGSATSLAQAALIVGAAHTGATNPAQSGAAGYSLLSYPNVPDNSLMLGEVNVIAGGWHRATMPGFYHAAQTSYATPSAMSGKLAGRTIMNFGAGPAGGGTTGGVYFDITGPWR